MAKKVSAFDKLRKASNSGGSSKSKSKIPSLPAPDELKKAIADLCELKMQIETLTGKRDAAAEAIRPVALQLRESQCREDRTIHASIKLIGDDSAVKVTQAARYLQMSGDVEDVIRATCGDDEIFDTFFKVETTYSFDEKAFMAIPNAEKVLEGVLKALGKHADILTCKSNIVPTEEYTRARVLDEKGRALAEQLESKGLAKPIAMSVSPV